ncbi:hypothetical protein ABZP36_012081 [Zizania latifolia]
MASAAASRPPPSPPPSPPAAAAAAGAQWLSPRVSFSLDDGGGGGGGDRGEAAVGGKASADFEFLLAAGCSAVSMLPADELFSGGKLVPLRLPGASALAAAVVEGEGVEVVATVPPVAPRVETETRVEVVETKGVAPVVEAAAAAVVEPKIPARRWRDLLRLRKQQASASATSEPKPLRRLLRRGPKPPEPEPSVSLPLLRESGPDEPEKPAPAPASAPTPTATPPSPSHQLPPKIRLSPAQAQAQATATPTPPPPPPAVAADSPRLNAAGKVVFNGLGRSSSSPSSLAGGRRHRGGGSIERSYSAHVRVAPVLNVPVCSLRGSRKSVSVFGIDRLFFPSSSSAAASSSSKKGKPAKKEATTTTSTAPQ